MNIKPIQTYYDGYRFRSRLEARWAVFFDALGLKYEYEPEGFIGAYQESYLPDFYFPQFDMYAEVKGSDEQLLKDAEKIDGAIDYGSTPMSYKGLILLGPIPYKKDCIPYFDVLFWHKGTCCTKCLFDIGPLIEHDEFYREKGKSPGWDFYGINGETDLWFTTPLNSIYPKYQHINNTYFTMKRPFEELNQCYLKARQARF